MCDPVLTRYKGRAAEGLPGKVLPTGLRASCLQGPWGPDAQVVALTCTPGRRAERVMEPPAWSRDVTPPGPQALGYGVGCASAGSGTDTRGLFLMVQSVTWVSSRTTCYLRQGPGPSSPGRVLFSVTGTGSSGRPRRPLEFCFCRLWPVATLIILPW